MRQYYGGSLPTGKLLDQDRYCNLHTYYVDHAVQGQGGAAMDAQQVKLWKMTIRLRWATREYLRRYTALLTACSLSGVGAHFGV